MFIRLAVRVSVRPCLRLSVCSVYVRPSARLFPFDNLSILNGLHSNFAYAYVPTVSRGS